MKNQSGKLLRPLLETHMTNYGSIIQHLYSSDRGLFAQQR